MFSFSAYPQVLSALECKPRERTGRREVTSSNRWSHYLDQVFILASSPKNIFFFDREKTSLSCNKATEKCSCLTSWMAFGIISLHSGTLAEFNKVSWVPGELKLAMIWRLNCHFCLYFWSDRIWPPGLVFVLLWIKLMVLSVVDWQSLYHLSHVASLCISFNDLIKQNLFKDIKLYYEHQ